MEYLAIAIVATIAGLSALVLAAVFCAPSLDAVTGEDLL